MPERKNSPDQKDSTHRGQFYAGVISIDNHRIRFAARDWKQMLALKILATHIRAIVAETVRQPTKELTHRERQWMELWQGIFD